MGVLYENFKSIPIDNEEISQSELNIDNKTRSNLFCWNGQFSPQFIETMLKKYAKQDFLVLDPFLGSGTTVSECARLGISAYGVELNVSAFWMAKTYECSNLSLMERWRIVAEVDKIISLIPNNENILDYILQGIKRNDDIMVTNILSTLVIVMDVYKNAITIELSGFCDTVLHNHSGTYSHNGYEYVLYCRRLPDIRRPIGTHGHNHGF